MELDIDTYFWLVDRGLVDDNQKNKVFLETNQVKLQHATTHQMENGIIVAQTMLLLRKSIIQISKKPFALDPTLNSLKDNVAEKIKNDNWTCVCKELRKFGIKVNAERKAKILQQKHLPIIEILNALYEFDNGGIPQNLAAQPPPETASSDNFSRSELLARDIETTSIDASPSNIVKGFSPAMTSVKKNIQNLSPSKQTDAITALEVSGKGPEEAESILEFMLLQLSKALEMKPNQAAGLLSSGQKYLMHVCIKGLKGGDYSKILVWYQELWVGLPIFLTLLQSEVEQAQLKACLNIIKAGLFSDHAEVCIWAARFLVKLGSELNKIGNSLTGEGWDWFTDASKPIKNLREFAGNEVQGAFNDSGLSAALFAMKKHPSEVLEHVVCMCHQFGQNNFLEMFTHHLPSQVDSKTEYVQTMQQFFHSGLLSTQMANECFVFSGVLEAWVEYNSQMAEFDGVNTLDDRCAAVVFLCDVWAVKPDFVDSRPEMGNNILSILKRSCRDKDKLLRVLSYEQLFRVFSVFAQAKVKHAPVIYKSIAFLLVEYHMDIDQREQMLTHFASIFNEFPMIPIAIAVEPLIKQIQMSEGQTFFWNVFDLDFFATISHHKRLSSNLAVQMLNLLCNLALSDVVFSSYATSIVLQLYDRFQRDTLMTQDIIRISVEGAINLLYSIERERKQSNQQRKKYENATNKRKEEIKQGGRNKRQAQKDTQTQELRDFEIEEEFNRSHSQRLLKEKLICGFLYRVTSQSIGILREELRKSMLETFTNLQKNDKIVSKALKWLLGIYDKNVDNLIKFYVANEQPSQLISRQQTDDFSQYGLGDGSQYKAPQFLEDSDAQSLRQYGRKPLSQSLSIPDPNLTRQQQKAMREIHRIKASQKQKEERDKLQRELKQMRQQKQRSQARRQVEDRIVELGFGRGEGSVMAEMRRGASAKSKNRAYRIVSLKEQANANNSMMAGGAADSLTDIGLQEQNIRLSPLRQKEKNKYDDTEIDLFDTTLEEDQDQNAAQIYIKKHNRILKSLFTYYSNSIARGKHQTSFDQYQNQTMQITSAEVLKLCKDYGMQPQSRQSGIKPITSDAIVGIMRSVNTTLMPQNGAQAKKSNLNMVFFDAFVEVMQQVSHFCFSETFKHKPPVEYLKLLFDQLRLHSKRHRTEKLFEEPDQGTGDDAEILRELNKRLKDDPYMQLPEDYSRVADKEVQYIYEMPQIPCYESQKIGVEVLDDLLFQMLGFHFLEPRVVVQKTVKVRHNIKHQSKLPLIPNRYMQGLEKNSTRDTSLAHPRNQQLKLTQSHALPRRASASHSRPPLAQKTAVNPTLNLTLMLQVAKAKLQDRADVQETAYVLEDVLGAVQQGHNHIPSRQQRAGPRNRIMQIKEEARMQEMQQEKQREQRLQKRKLELDQVMQYQAVETQKKREYKQQETRIQEEKDEETKKRKQQNVKQFYSGMRQKAMEDKSRRMADQEALEYQKQQQDQEKRQKSKATNQMIKNQQVQTQKAQSQKQEQIRQKQYEEQMKKDQQEQKQLKKKQQMNGFYTENKQSLQDMKQKEKESLLEFATSAPIQSLLSSYQSSLQSCFTRYCKTDSQPDKLTKKAFIKLSTGTQIVPALTSSKEAVQVFKTMQADKYVDKHDEPHLVYFEFVEALVKIATLCKGKLKGGNLGRQASLRRGVGAEYDVEGLGVEEMRTLLDSMGLQPKKK